MHELNTMNLKEEKEIVAQVERGEYKSVENFNSLKNTYGTYAENTITKDKTVDKFRHEHVNKINALVAAKGKKI